MKKLLMVMVASLAFAAMAQDKGPDARPRRPHGGPHMSEHMGMRGMGMGMGMMGDPAVMAAMNPMVAEKIGVSAEVQEKLKKLEQDMRQGTRDLQQKVRDAMNKQAGLMKAEKIDEAAVMATVDELFEARKAIAKAQTRRVIAVKSLLTPEQLQKAQELVKKMREERRAGRGPGARPANAGAKKPEGAAPTPPAADKK